mgnify:FL=1
MFTKIPSFALRGIEGVLIEVEVDLTFKTPKFIIVGLPDAAIKEAQFRVKTAMRNSGYCFPYQRILVNLAPADIKKQGPLYDLPITIGLLAGSNQIPVESIANTAFAGELALDGNIRPIRGVISMLEIAYKAGIKKIVVPQENAHEASLPGLLEVYPVKNLPEAVQLLTDQEKRKPFIQEMPQECHESRIDYREVVGQEYSKRAMLIAACGEHHCLMIGSPGSGKTMLARRITTILPRLSLAKAMETTRIYSISGLLAPEKGILFTPPFRSPHHTISSAGMAGGGSNPKPGELSLSHNGVLFLDELPEFNRTTLEVLRQPIESGQIIISRAKETVSYPARFLLLAAMNPCPCGYHGDSLHSCHCDWHSIDRYRRKISGPLLDRFDIQVQFSRIAYQDLVSEPKGIDSKTMYDLVVRTRSIQKERLCKHNLEANAQMPPDLIRKYCSCNRESEQLLSQAMNKRGFSARAYHKILRMARTIADLEQSQNIQPEHICEAIQYRCMENMPVY